MSKINLGIIKGENTSPSNSLPLVAGVTDNKDLSKLVSGHAKPQLLAFFVPKFCLTSQVGNTKAQTHLNPFTGLNRHIRDQNASSYGGVTLQNIKAFRRICEAVSNKTESEPRHPLRNFRNAVVLTQNLLGVASNG